MATAKPDHLPLFDDVLRDYQKDFIGAVRGSFRCGRKAVMGVLPTGMGKTTTTVCLPREGARVMVIVQSDPLVPQWIDTIRHLRRRAAAVEQAAEWADGGEEWMVAMVQTLQSNDRYKRLLGKVDLIVVDECDTHFSIAWRSMMQEFIAAGARVLGLTATPYRGDKASLFGFYEDVPYCMELRTAFDEGWLVQPKVKLHRVKSLQFDALTRTKVDFKPEEIAGLMESEAVLHEVCNLIKEKHTGTHGVVRCRSVKQAQKVRELLVERYGIPASCVWGKQNREEREAEIAKFESGEHPLIVNCRVLGRGWDCPQVQAIFNAAPTKNKATFVQGLGRGTRALKGVLNNSQTKEERLAAIAASAKPWWMWHDLTNTSRYHTPVTAIEILLAGSREIIQKVQEKAEEEPLTLAEMDEAMAEEIRRAEEMERLAREAEKERRRGLIVGVTFDSRDRGLFDKPDAKTPKVRGYYMPIRGKYSGRPLRDPVIPVSYLQWALREARLNAMWTVAFQQEVERREKAKRESQEPSTSW